jgi:hypothetical protein
MSAGTQMGDKKNLSELSGLCEKLGPKGEWVMSAGTPMGEKNKTLASLAGFARNKIPKSSG